MSTSNTHERCDAASPPGCASETKRDHLQKLRLLLAARGFWVDLGSSRTGVPLLLVTNPDQPGLLSENIACVAGLDGALRYGWPWGSHLAEAGDLNAAVADVIRVLGGGDG